MKEEPNEIHAPLLRAHLQAAGLDLPILHFPEIDSTNLEVQRQLDAGRSPPFAILASKQQSGRGRLGRKWHSPEEGNCYLSFALIPDSAADEIQQLTYWIGLRVCRLLKDYWQIPVRMKWPNDLIIQGRKVGGMLCETRTEGEKLRHLIFGIGINVNCRCSEWPQPIRETAISLAEERGKELALNRLTAMIVVDVMRAWHQFRAGEFAGEIPEASSGDIPRRSHKPSTTKFVIFPG